MTFTTAFIRQPKSWESLSESVLKITRNQATEVRYVACADDIAVAPGVVHIVVVALAGFAEYAIEIYWAGTCDMPNDTVGMFIACSISADVLVSADDMSPTDWLLLSPNGMVKTVKLDIDKLRSHNFVEYEVED